MVAGGQVSARATVACRTDASVIAPSVSGTSVMAMSRDVPRRGSSPFGGGGSGCPGHNGCPACIGGGADAGSGPPYDGSSCSGERMLLGRTSVSGPVIRSSTGVFS